ncbi:MAG: hypothetical protein LBD45_05530 [Bacteroidales bacterium]|nr:hypothetical protein [Bacteroidales bacterium]
MCDSFPPAFAPRMGYLCKYLPAYGWEPVVVTEDIQQNMFPELAENVDVTRIDYFASSNRIVRKLKFALVFLADLLFDYKENIIGREAQKKIDLHPIKLILVSSYRTFPLKAARKLSRRNQIPYIVDLRDIIEQYGNNEFISKKMTEIRLINDLIASVLKRKLLRQRNKSLRQAAGVTTVSPWHVEILQKYNKNISLIYNGFDSELFIPENIPVEQFRITYTGRIHSFMMQDPSLLFEAVSETSRKGIIQPTTCRIQFYVNESSKKLLEPLVRQYGVTDFVDYFPFVFNTDIPEILNKSSILLLLTNKTSLTGPKGVMTTKFFEYLAVEKPILCIRNDKGCLEAALQETQAGVAANTAEEVADFLLDKYREWGQTGYTRQLSDKKAIMNYSRKKQAEQFISIIESILSFY